MLIRSSVCFLILGLLVPTLSQNFVYTYDADSGAPPQSNLFDPSTFRYVPPSAVGQGQQSAVALDPVQQQQALFPPAPPRVSQPRSTGRALRQPAPQIRPVQRELPVQQQEYIPERVNNRPVAYSSYPEHPQSNYGSPLQGQHYGYNSGFNASRPYVEEGQYYNQYGQSPYDYPYQYFNMVSHRPVPTNSYAEQGYQNINNYPQHYVPNAPPPPPPQQPQPAVEPSQQSLPSPNIVYNPNPAPSPNSVVANPNPVSSPPQNGYSYYQHAQTPYYQPAANIFSQSVQPAFDSFMQNNQHYQYRPQQSVARAQQPGVRAQQPAVRAQQPAVRAQQPVVRAQQPVVRAQQPAQQPAPQADYYPHARQAHYQPAPPASSRNYEPTNYYQPAAVNSLPAQTGQYLEDPQNYYQPQERTNNYRYQQQYVPDNVPQHQYPEEYNYEPERTVISHPLVTPAPQNRQRTQQQRPAATVAPVTAPTPTRSRRPTVPALPAAPLPQRQVLPPVTEAPRSTGSTFKPSNLLVAALPDDTDGDGIPGRAGNDYPTLHVIPKTSFSCGRQPLGGYYADQETACQVVHFCQTGGIQHSFLCPNGTIFNQEKFSCQWWYRVDCANAASYYALNDNLYKTTTPKPKARRQRPVDNNGK